MPGTALQTVDITGNTPHLLAALTKHIFQARDRQ